MNEPAWIELRDALAIHDRALALHGGAEGIRDQGLLECALARPRQMHAYVNDPDWADLSAALTAGVVRNRPFVDGNKRTGFLLGVLFLELNGLEFVAKEEDAAQAVLSLAGGNFTEAEFRNWLGDNIAGWVKGVSRQ